MTPEESRARAAVRELPRDGLAQLGEASGPWADWGRGVLLQARGDFRTSFPLLRTSIDTAGSDDVVRALAAARIASGLRQLGEHGHAVAWDRRATRVPLADGWIGLAADQVGSGDAAAASALLARARPTDTRDRIRRAWVSCEIALLQGRPTNATAHATRALRWSHTWGPRHTIKSTLFLAASVRSSDPDRAVRLLGPAQIAAVRGQLWPLVWPMTAVLADRADTDQTATAARAVGYISARLPTEIGDTWSTRPDISRWLRAGQ